MKRNDLFASPLWVASAMLMAFIMLISTAAPALAATFTITPSSPGGWGFLQENATGTGSFMYGPGTSPAGTGSARFVINNTGGLYLGSATAIPAGTDLDDITTLQYSTYRSSVNAGNNLAVTLQLNVDFDNSDTSYQWQGRLVYEPYHTYPGTILQDTWQTWNAIESTGKWWKTGRAYVGNVQEASISCPQSNPCTWADIKTMFPNAEIHSTLGAIGFKAGSSWSDGFDGNVDNFQVGINGNNDTYDFEHDPAPTVLTGGVGMFPALGDGLIDAGEVFTAGFNQLTVSFSQDLYNPNTTDPDSVTNPDNYELLLDGVTPIAIDSVSFNNNGGSGPYIATVSINGGVNLTPGVYTFTVQGDTSVVNLDLVPIAGNGATAGTDFVRTFTITTPAATTTQPSTLPATGFRPGEFTRLPAQPKEKLYASTDLMLEIPSLGRTVPIVGVPITSDGWDVTWLGDSAGWLNGTAFPTWAGNTVITGHVWDAYNNPGIFYGLKDLKYGDQIKIHAWGQTYTYEVRESRLVSPRNVKAALKSEEYDWVTLVTCEDYNFLFSTYSYRRVVRAVLISVE